MKLKDQILEKITKEKIKPTPRWIFLAKNYLVWTIAGTSLVIGGIAAALIISMMKSNDWDLFPYLGRSFAGFLLLSIPYLWLVVFGVFAAAVFYELRKTKTGYQYNSLVIIGTSLVASFVIGTLVYEIDLGPKIGNVLERFPLYQTMLFHKSGLWHNPETGFLAGRITSVDDEKSFELESVDGGKWSVMRGEPFEIFPPNLEIIQGEMIKALGKKIDEKDFRANEVRPLLGPVSGQMRLQGTPPFEDERKN